MTQVTPSRAPRFGASVTNIDPISPCSLAGYFNERPWKSILDDLEVRALVLENNGRYFGIVQFDLVTIPWTFFQAFLKKLGDRSPFGRHNLIVTATHTHTAPEIRENKPGYGADYVEMAVEKSVAALSEALGNLEEASFFVARTEERRFAFNRRYWTRDGRVVTNPPKLDPNVERPEGVTDPEIPILAIKDARGRVRVALANIVNHADTIGGDAVSADWPGVFRRKIQAAIGTDVAVFPLIGCSGNINHLDIRTSDAQFSRSESERIGSGYAETVLAAIKNHLVPAAAGSFNTASIDVALPQKIISEKEISEARRVLLELGEENAAEQSGDSHSVDLAKNNPRVLRYFAEQLLRVAADKTEKRFTLNALALGDIRVVSFPAEPFVEIGLKIKNEIFMGKTTFVASHANGTGSAAVSGSYVPNSWNYGRGGYETTPRSNPLPENTADVLLEAIRQLKTRLDNGP